jgi:hypothetical protein
VVQTGALTQTDTVLSLRGKLVLYTQKAKAVHYYEMSYCLIATSCRDPQEK